ncbi:MAG: hypothetical protein CMF31_10530 [Kordiimonas sp.]|nr:hypothetical protein [Kordiimonas sp.]
MSIVSHIVVFVVAWWLLFFMVLPWGVRSLHEVEEEYDEGLEAGAPHNPKLKQKVLITTGLTIIVWGLFWLVNKYELITIS